TLIEVMMAMVVMALVFGGVISSMVRAASLTRDSKVIYRETAIINDAIEKMRAMTFDELKTYLGTKEITIPPSGAGTAYGLAGAYTYKLKQESNVGDDPIRITLTIHPENQPHRNISVVTYISSAGLINKK
ncbi:MAG TPA: type II secretion system protein, partial [Anaerolineaceae bacterium]|nr:type II secretion system protein [Anaerolineaceae bacterium]